MQITEQTLRDGADDARRTHLLPPALRNRLTFYLERLIQRGAFYQLLVIAGLIGLVAMIGGLLAHGLSGGFDHAGEAIWWAFLRLTDPGYLGDDEGALLRTISTVVTVLGYVLFMGSLIAILTQWLNQTVRRLESGLTPVAVRGHFLILGWTNRTPAIVQELVISEGRVRRFLQRRGLRRLRIVILAEEVNARLVYELRDRLGPRWDERQFIFRSGSSLRPEHLRRVNPAEAAVIVIPGADFALGGNDASDARVIKTLLSIAGSRPARLDGQHPPVVAEIIDVKRLPILHEAYRAEIDVVAGDAFISRLIVQNVRHRGLSFIYADLLSHQRGHALFVRPAPELAGHAFSSLHVGFPNAILLGVVRPYDGAFRAVLNPPADFRVEPDDRLVLVAEDFEATAPVPGFQPAAFVAQPAPSGEASGRFLRRVLLLGWSHKVLSLVQEFAEFEGEHYEIDVVSVVPITEREAELARFSLPPRIRLRQIEADYTIHADLAALDPAGYDNIVLIGSDWLEDGAASDARTILGYVLLRAVLPERGRRTEVIVELLDPENTRLLGQRAGEVIVSPLILSHLLAHIALRRELGAVFSELFGAGGAEIALVPASRYTSLGQSVCFDDLRKAAAQQGDIALGVRLHAEAGDDGNGVHLNPPIDQRWTLGDGDELIVLTTG